MENYKDPYAGMKFDPKPFDTEIGKVKDSFDSSIQEAGMQAGMSAGNTGLNPGRVTADVYSRAMSERDKVVGGLEGQKAGAQAQFDQQKQVLSAQGKAEYEKAKPGIMDWVSGGLNVATSIATMNPFGILGGVKTFGGLMGGGGMSKYKPGPISGKPVITDNSGMSTFDPNSIKLNYGNNNDSWSGFRTGTPFKLKPAW